MSFNAINAQDQAASTVGFLETARPLAARGCYVFPCRPDKKPYTARGFLDASLNFDDLEAWARRWPDALVGIDCGRSVLFVIDIDRKNGKDGLPPWGALCSAHGGEVSTYTTATPTGGFHAYYRGAGRSTVNALGDGIDTRSVGGYVIAYPPVIDIPVVPAPEWLTRAAGEVAPRALPESAQLVPAEAREPLTRLDLAAYADSGQGPTNLDARAVLEGRAWGAPGSRDNAASLLCFALAARFPALDPEGTADLFVRSCEAVQAADGVETTTAWVAEKLRQKLLPAALRSAQHELDAADARRLWAEWRAVAIDRDDLAKAARGAGREAGKALRALAKGKPLDPGGLDAAVDALAKAAFDKGLTIDVDGSVAAFTASGVDEDEARKALITRSEAIRVQHEARVRSHAEGRAGCIQRAFNSERTEPYTTDELAAMHPIEKRWVIGTGQGYFLRGPLGYEGPFPAEILPARARDALAPACDLHLVQMKGERWTPKNATQLLHEYGTVPARLRYTYSGETALKDDVFVQRVAHLRALEPTYHEGIATWLRYFGGDKHEALLDWIATITMQDKPSAGLLFVGASAQGTGTGKGMFVAGLARLWGAEATPFDQAVGKFNAGLLRCPLIHADEQIRVPYGEGRPVELLKEAITAVARTVADKNVKGAELEGAVRLVLTVNNDAVTKLCRDLTPGDIAALDERILVVRSSDDTKHHLESIGGWATTTAWVEGDLLARHALWLVKTREVQLGTRFAVRGEGIAASLETQGERGEVLAAVMGALEILADSTHENPRAPVVVDKGQVWVSQQYLASAWGGLFRGVEAAARPDDMKGVLDILCEPGPSKQFDVPNSTPRERVRRRAIKLDRLRQHAYSQDKADILANALQLVSAVSGMSQGG